MHCRPQVEDIALGGTVRLEALKNVFAQVDGEGPVGVFGLAVDGTTAATLVSSATQIGEQPKLCQRLLHGDLLAKEGEVDPRSRGPTW